MSRNRRSKENYVEGAMGIASPPGLHDNIGMNGMAIPSGMRENYCGSCTRMIPDKSVIGYIPDLEVKPTVRLAREQDVHYIFT